MASEPVSGTLNLHKTIQSASWVEDGTIFALRDIHAARDLQLTCPPRRQTRHRCALTVDRPAGRHFTIMLFKGHRQFKVP